VCHLFMNKVKIHLYVLGAAMKQGISYHICGPLQIVTPQTRSVRRNNSELSKDTLNPNEFTCGIGQHLIISFCARSRDDKLFVSTPRNQIGTKGRSQHCPPSQHSRSARVTERSSFECVPQCCVYYADSAKYADQC
jgi:hypothetical protein